MLTKKKIIILGISVSVLLISLILILLLPSKSSPQPENANQNIRPSATGIYRIYEPARATATPVVPTIFIGGATLKPTLSPTSTPTRVPSPSVVPTHTISPTPREITLGRLSYMQGRDIYNTDLKMTQNLTETYSSSSANLKWSAKGSYISWIDGKEAATGIAVYHLDSGRKYALPMNSFNFIDYSWSPDEKEIIWLTSDLVKTSGNIFSADNPTAIREIVVPVHPIRGYTWLKNGRILAWGVNEIYAFDPRAATPGTLITQDAITFASVSPDESKVVYSTVNSDIISWFILNLSTNVSTPIVINNFNSNFLSVDLPTTAFQKGMDSKAVWFPSSEKLFITIKYLRDFPVVGIYDISTNYFSAVSFFNIKNSDFMSDAFTLIGERQVNTNGVQESQIHLFTIEGNAKLGLIKVIPQAHSPTFYRGE